MTQHDHDDIHEAILAVQAELPSIPKDATADTGKYTYNYMRIERLYQELLPILHDHGLVWIVAGAEPSEGRWIVGRLILVGADQGVESYWPLPASDDPQLIGASMTYGKRYMLCGLVGLVGEEDRDGLPPQQQESSDASSDRTMGDLRELIREAKKAGVSGDFDASLEFAEQHPVNIDVTYNKIARALAKKQAQDAEDGPPTVDDLRGLIAEAKEAGVSGNLDGWLEFAEKSPANVAEAYNQVAKTLPDRSDGY